MITDLDINFANTMIGGYNFQIPDLIEPIVLFRNWRTNYNNDLLSPHREYLWSKKENQSSCIHCNSNKPQKNCSCGLYGYYSSDYNDDEGVIGIIRCWGTIEVHEVGARVQYADIVAISASSSISNNKLKQIAKKYNCLTTNRGNLENISKWFGKSLD